MIDANKIMYVLVIIALSMYVIINTYLIVKSVINYIKSQKK